MMETVSKLDHPNIAKYYFKFKDTIPDSIYRDFPNLTDNVHFYVFNASGSLQSKLDEYHTWLRNGVITIDEIQANLTKYVSQISSVLTFATNNSIFPDINTNNIFLNKGDIVIDLSYGCKIEIREKDEKDSFYKKNMFSLIKSIYAGYRTPKEFDNMEKKLSIAEFHEEFKRIMKNYSGELSFMEKICCNVKGPRYIFPHNDSDQAVSCRDAKSHSSYKFDIYFNKSLGRILEDKIKTWLSENWFDKDKLPLSFNIISGNGDFIYGQLPNEYGGILFEIQDLNGPQLKCHIGNLCNIVNIVISSEFFDQSKEWCLKFAILHGKLIMVFNFFFPKSNKGLAFGHVIGLTHPDW